MNDKIKWYGRYLGCKYGKGLGRLRLTESSLYDAIHSDSKLILKELKDISEEDAICCIRIASGDLHCEIKIVKRQNGFGYSSCYKSSKRRRNHGYGDHSFAYRQLNSEQIDSLRSKGYAIGIPKEYYITEDELKK